MFFRSLFYERTILQHLERVEQLPPEVQAEIAMRVGNLIELAKASQRRAVAAVRPNGPGRATSGGSARSKI
jgi:hypothetical protein